MSFRFRVINAGHLERANAWYVDVRLECGAVRPGSRGSVAGSPGRALTVKSVALVDPKSGPDDLLTLSLEPPDFPIGELIGKVISGDDP